MLSEKCSNNTVQSDVQVEIFLDMSVPHKFSLLSSENADGRTPHRGLVSYLPDSDSRQSSASKFENTRNPYHPNVGESKLNAVRDVLRHLRFMLKYKLSQRSDN